MNTIHLSRAQIEELKEIYASFSPKFRNRPSFKGYCHCEKRLKKLISGKPPKQKDIPNTIKGYEAGDIKLLPAFSARTDLPPGWAVVSYYDSGGNHFVENAAITVWRNMWNNWLHAEAILNRAIAS